MIDSLKHKFRWLFSPHYKMERFGIMFGSLMLCMALCMTLIVRHKIQEDRQTLGNNVVYTTQMTMSLSGSVADVVDVFSNSAQTKAFVLLKWRDMSSVVTDAADYRVFLTGSDMNMNKEELLCKPQATIYMFGVTGYMGIYLVDMAGFQSQILDMVLRCDSMAGTLPTEIPSYEDKSFEQHDQGRMYFNPGAAGFKTVDFLENDRMDVRTIYNDSIIVAQETVIRDKLTADLEAMQAALLQIDEYTRRVESSGIVVPSAPVQIRGDRVIEADATGRLDLVTDYVLSGGYDFDWYHGSVLDGYLDAIVPGDQTATRYISAMRTQAAGGSFNTNSLKWVRVSNGSDFYAEDDTIQSASRAQIHSNIEGLINAWQTYYQAKKAYQTTDMESLLLLELDAVDISSNFTTNVGTVDKPAIVLW